MAGISIIRFLGDPFIQYGDVIADPDAASSHLEAAWTAVAGRGASAGIFRRVRSDAKVAPIFARHARCYVEAQAPFVDVQQLAEPASPNARELRRLRRRLAERGQVHFQVLRGPSAGEALRSALKLKHDWLIERGLPSAVVGNRDWEGCMLQLVDSAAERSELVAACLKVEDSIVAIEIGFIHNKVWFAYMGTTVPAFAKSGPGRILMDELVAWCGQQGFVAYDLLPPSEPYKRTITPHAVSVRDYVMAFTPIGRSAYVLTRALSAAKGIVGGTPPWLRRHMMRHFS